MSVDVTASPPPPRYSIAAYWLNSIKRMVSGAIAEGVPEDAIYGAVVAAIQEGSVTVPDVPITTAIEKDGDA
jgi:hypothetical protein